MTFHPTDPTDLTDLTDQTDQTGDSIVTAADRAPGRPRWSLRLNGRVRIVLLASGLLIAAAVAAWRLPQTAAPAGPFRVIQRLQQPVGGAMPDPMQLASSARDRWRAEDVRASWTRVQSGQSATLRSPRLELPDDFHAVIVTRSGLQQDHRHRAAPLVRRSNARRRAVCEKPARAAGGT